MNGNLTRALAIAATIAAVAWGGAAAAATDFTGSSVTGTLYIPNLASPYGTPQTETVGPGVEFAACSLGSCAGPMQIPPFTVDVSGNQIIIVSHHFGGYLSAPFNGFVLSFAGAPDIIGLAVDPTTNVTGGSAGFTSDSILINASGAFSPENGVTVLDVSFARSAAPEPSTWAMMALGFFGLGGLLRASRRSGALRDRRAA